MYDGDPARLMLEQTRMTKLKKWFKSIVQSNFLIPILIFITFASLLFWQVDNLLSTSRMVNHTEKVIAEAHLIENEIMDLQSGIRGYALTGDSSFLEPYKKALPSFQSNIKKFKNLLRDNPLHKKRIDRIKTTMDRWIDHANVVIRITSSHHGLPDNARMRYGKSLIEQVRSEISKITSFEEGLKKNQVNAAEGAATGTFFTTIFGLLLFGAMVLRGLFLRRKNESALRASREEFKLMVESIQDYAIFKLDPEGHILTWNEGAERIKGYKEEEVIGKHFSLFYTQEDRDRGHPSEELEIAKKEGKYTEEGWRIRKDGSRFWASIVLTALKNESHKNIGFVKITQDLTAKKLAEEELKKARDQLEIRVKERTLELEKVMQAREDVLAMVSHDLKNPLNAIKLSAKLLIKSEEKNNVQTVQETQAKRIVRASERMEQLITDILDIAKMDAGTFSIEIHPERIEEIVRESAELFDEAAKEKGISLFVEIEPPCCFIKCDYQRILQVFSNIIGNALKFTPPGGSIMIHAEEKNGWAQFSVHDSGPGIAEKLLPHIFDRFWQANETRAKGAGLGLFIARGIIEAHGGRIWAESQIGKGTTFYFKLPLIK